MNKLLAAAGAAVLAVSSLAAQASPLLNQTVGGYLTTWNAPTHSFYGTNATPAQTQYNQIVSPSAFWGDWEATQLTYFLESRANGGDYLTITYEAGGTLRPGSTGLQVGLEILGQTVLANLVVESETFSAPGSSAALFTAVDYNGVNGNPYGAQYLSFILSDMDLSRSASAVFFLDFGQTLNNPVDPGTGNSVPLPGTMTLAALALLCALPMRRKAAQSRR